MDYGRIATRNGAEQQISAPPQAQYGGPQRQQYVPLPPYEPAGPAGFYFPPAAVPGAGGDGAYGAPAVGAFQAGAQQVFTDPSTGRRFFMVPVPPPSAGESSTVIVAQPGGVPPPARAARLYVDDYGCALFGLVLAFLIPIAGWITFCVNARAPPRSRTRRYAVEAGFVGSGMFVVYLCIAVWGGHQNGL
jgi:hypothetical protein